MFESTGIRQMRLIPILAQWEDILDHCCFAWNKLIDMPWKIMSIGSIIINETWYHTIITGTTAFECNGKRAEFGPGGFNYMPARKVHEAWIAAGAVIFITLDGKALQRSPT